jgi:esterase/lipase
LKLPNVPAYWVAFWQASIGGQSDLTAMEQRVNQSHEDIILYGVSRGGLVVAKYAFSLSSCKNIKGIVLEGAPFSIFEVIKENVIISFLLETITNYKRDPINENWISNILETIPISKVPNG